MQPDLWVREPVAKFSYEIKVGDETVPVVGHMEFPVDDKDKIRALIGEGPGAGSARVSVTNDFGLKHYGNGVSCSVTVTLTCDQNLEAVAAAEGWAKHFALKFSRDVFAEAEQEYRAELAKRGKSDAYGF